MMENGKSGVTVKKTELLKAMRKNRSTHTATFLQAQKGYREAIIRELDVMLAEARGGKRIRRSVSLIEPEDHSKDYDRVIRMLEMSVQATIFISDHEFGCYVQDDWGWKESFTNSTQGYR